MLMMEGTSGSVAGWDLGGAHLKVALAEEGQRIAEVVQLPCPLWLGMERLGEAIETARPRLGGARRHAVTMTGELVDLFQSRADGVARLIEAMVRAFPEDEIRVYAGHAGFLPAAEAAPRPDEVASANWHASAGFVAARQDQALFIDVGSTTTDLVPLRGGRVESLGYTDTERLVSEELVYGGVTRTPVMAIADHVPFAGARQGVMAEHFATMADVYRLTGALPEEADQLPAADGADKSLPASRRRLARMLGRDAESAAPADWRRLALYLAERQRQGLMEACARVLSRGLLEEAAPLVGAGVGRFLASEIAARLDRPYVDFSALVAGSAAAKEGAARCAPAAAVALLGMDARWA